jgi:hypothetical protein
MNEPTDRTLYCSFCGKSQHEVKTLIAGPNVFICNECVTLCMDVLFKKDELPAGAMTAQARQVAQTEAMKSILRYVDEIVARERHYAKPYEELAAVAEEFRKEFDVQRPITSQGVVSIRQISEPSPPQT